MTRGTRTWLVSIVVALALGLLTWSLARRTSPATTVPDAVPVRDPTPFTGTRTGLVKSVFSEDGAHVLRVDFVDFLTGVEAAKAASAHGDESPPPNDYYVENDDRAVHDLPIHPSAEVRVVIDDDGTSLPEGRAISLTEWIAGLSGPQARLFEANVYRMEITRGVLTELEQIYVP